MQQAKLAPYWSPQNIDFLVCFSLFLGTSRHLRLHPAPHLLADKCKKHQKTITFITNLTNAARPPWGPRMGRHKYDHPTLTPKSSQGNHTKHWFSGRILTILLFGIHVAIAPSVPFILKIIKKALVLQCCWRPRWAQHRTPKGKSEIKKWAPRCMGAFRQKKERAPRCMGTIFAFSWSRLMPQMGPQKMSQTFIFKLFLMFRGSHSRSNSVEEAPSQTSATLHGSAISPKTCKKPLVLQQKRCPQRGHLEASGLGGKKLTTQSGRQRAP